MADDDFLAGVFGNGLGSFPRRHLERGPADNQPATFGFAVEQGNTYFRLGSGATVYYAQRIPFEAGRTYRLALACTGEYANFHGSFGTDKTGALAAMATSMTRVNGVYEIEVGVRMIMVPNNANLVYTNPSTDPYTNNNGSTMLGQNNSTCNSVIGSANYDIGHVFSTGGGGITLGSTVNGAQTLAVNTTGTTAFAGALCTPPPGFRSVAAITPATWPDGGAIT